MIGNTVALTDITRTSPYSPTSTPATTLYVPLQFWFCRNPGLNIGPKSKFLNGFASCGQIHNDTIKLFGELLKHTLLQMQIALSKSLVIMCMIGQSAKFARIFNDYMFVGGIIPLKI